VAKGGSGFLGARTDVTSYNRSWRMDMAQATSHRTKTQLISAPVPAMRTYLGCSLSSMEVIWDNTLPKSEQVESSSARPVEEPARPIGKT